MLRKFFMIWNVIGVILAAVVIGREARSVSPLVWLVVAVLNSVAFGIQWFLGSNKKEANRAS